MSQVRIGISGWTYAPWRGTFFPKDLVQREELAYAARQVSSIEINGTFYRLQKPDSYARWAAETPPDFVFSIKAPRYITHILRLRDAAVPVANFLASGVLRLGPKLGPILWQLPPSLRYDRNVLEDFLTLLPHDTKAAAVVAHDHDDKVKAAWLVTDQKRPLRHALEIRHPSFAQEEFIGLLRKYRVALVVADTAGKWPLLEDLTADFSYVRLHGDAELYVSGYTPAALRRWAAKVRAWRDGKNAPKARLVARPASTRARGRDVFVYFDNDVKTQAPFDACNLSRLLGLREKCAAAPHPSTVAEEARSHWPVVGKKRAAARQRL